MKHSRQIIITIETEVENAEVTASYLEVAQEDVAATINERLDEAVGDLVDGFNEGVTQYAGFKVSVSSKELKA